MRVIETVREMRIARATFPSLGLVPTMGFLHSGHLSLVKRAKAECGSVAVSIFVNPTQFGPNEDLSRYPRDLPRDLSMLSSVGVDLVFTPPPTAIYPQGFSTRIEVGQIAEPLEGRSRPEHFSGVATVVAKLFNIVQPTRAYFGQKDAQQCLVVHQMSRDLNLPVEIVVCPTVREPDGLAMSSRNAYLSPKQRAAAPILFKALSDVQIKFDAGARDPEILRAVMQSKMESVPELIIDYISVADPGTLEELAWIDRSALASLAARLGTTRLIDNILLETTAPTLPQLGDTTFLVGDEFRLA